MKLVLLTQLSTLLALPGAAWCAQPDTPPIPQAEMLITTNFASAPFPHPQRANGHTYRGEVFRASLHYADNRVALIVPGGFRPGKQVDFVVHSHGWRAALDELLEKFKLVDQFRASGRNAVLVVPQGPLRAPDSFGGKLEDPDGLRNLLTEALAVLRARGVSGPADIGRVILSGHSGGYHAIAAMLDRGGLPDSIREVYLFDGLYGETDKYLAWLKRGRGKLINIYTDDGGTKTESERMIDALGQAGVPVCRCREKDLDLTELRSQRALFVHSDLGHDGVLFERQQFSNFLRASLLEPLGHGREVVFGGCTWTVRSGRGGPGPNAWEPENVWLDASTNLHLKIAHREGEWSCAEVTMQKRLGFGRYQFQTIGRIDRLDDNVVLGLFNYPTRDVGPDATHEIDIEFARWGEARNPLGNFTVWPVERELKQVSKAFPVMLRGDEATHRFTWSRSQIVFHSVNGHREDDRETISTWTYGPSEPARFISQRPMPVHINLWLFQGRPPKDGQEVEVIIRDFKYTPNES